MTRLIFIHGINNEDNSVEQIRAEWGNALNDGMKTAGLEQIPVENIECAYYGKLLADGAQKWGASRGIGQQNSISESDGYKKLEKELEEKFSHQAIVELIESTTVDDQQYYDSGLAREGAEIISRSENLYKSSESGGARAAGYHKSGLIASAKFLEKISPKLAKTVIGKFLKQSMAYLEDEKLHAQINKTVVDQLFTDKSKKDEPHIVVTHSNGTLLSYFLFSSALKDWNIRAWYTIGSPLGAKTLQSYLLNSDRYPGRVQTWYHCWDTEDFVSYNTPLTKDTIGIDGIVNINTFDTSDEDKHSITSYLSHAMLARLIAQDYFD